MGKSLAAVACSIAVAFSATSSQALPAPEPGDIELSGGLTQWGAETEFLAGMSREEMLAPLLKLTRPGPVATSKTAMCETLAAAAQVHELPVGFFVRLINQESGFNPASVSS